MGITMQNDSLEIISLFFLYHVLTMLGHENPVTFPGESDCKYSQTCVSGHLY